jgi:uncharacterized protein YfiM (DUF2279 family)
MMMPPRLNWITLIFALLLALLAACSPSAVPVIRLDAELLREDFSSPRAWESYYNAEQGMNFAVEEGVYKARVTQTGIMWTLHSEVHSDVVIEVETTQISTWRDNAYGLMCRAAPSGNGNGYYFLISADGQYTIRRGARDQITALIPWRASGAIRQDRAINRIRIACIGERLLLFVNDEFVAETRDSLYRSGSAGITAGMGMATGAQVNRARSVEIWFDALIMWAASFP